MEPPMPPGLEPFDIFKHTGFKVCCDALLKPGFWGIDEKDVIWMAPDVFKRLQTVKREREDTK